MCIRFALVVCVAPKRPWHAVKNTIFWHIFHLYLSFAHSLFRIWVLLYFSVAFVIILKSIYLLYSSSVIICGLQIHLPDRAKKNEQDAFEWQWALSTLNGFQQNAISFISFLCRTSHRKRWPYWCMFSMHSKGKVPRTLSQTVNAHLFTHFSNATRNIRTCIYSMY